MLNLGKLYLNYGQILLIEIQITARTEGRYEKIASSRPCGNSKFLVHSPKYLVLNFKSSKT